MNWFESRRIDPVNNGGEDAHGAGAVRRNLPGSPGGISPVELKS